MEDPTDDILERLESAIQAWTDEVDEAQQRIGARLAQTRGHIATTSETGTAELESVLREQFLGLQRVIEDCTGALRDALVRMDALDRDVAELKQEIAQVRAPDTAVREPDQQAYSDAPPPPTGERKRKVPIRPFDENGAPRRMGEILVDAGLISSAQLESALEVQRHAPQRKLGSILVEQGFTSEEVVPQVLARQLRVPYLRLKEKACDPEAAALISGRLAAKHACIPVRAAGGSIALAMANPLDLIAIEDIEHATGHQVRPLIARESEIMDAIARHYGPDATAE